MTATPDPLSTSPVFWTEVFSRPDARWFPIDPIRSHINDRKVFDPSPSNINVSSSMQRGSTVYPYRYASNNNRTTGTKVENRMVYVLAFEEDGYARDVTRRYAREYSAKVAKVQGGSSAPNIGGGGKGRQAWWSSVMNAIHRPFRLVSISSL
jgi:xeroderma pigmentosum group C-complementing protein